MNSKAPRKVIDGSGKETTFCVRGTDPPIRGRPRKLSNSEKTTTTKNLSQHKIIQQKRKAEATVQCVIEGHYSQDHTDYQADMTVREESDSDDGCSSNSSGHGGHADLYRKCKDRSDKECRSKSYSRRPRPLSSDWESRSRLGKMRDPMSLSRSADGISFRLRPIWLNSESVSVKYSDLRNLLNSAEIAPQGNNSSSQTVKNFHFRLQSATNTVDGEYFDGVSTRGTEGSRFPTDPDLSYQVSHSRRRSQPLCHHITASKPHQMTATTQKQRARSVSAVSLRDHPNATQSAQQERVNSDSSTGEGSRLIWTHAHACTPKPRPQWYEMKTPEFCVEARRNTALVRTQT